MSVTFDGKEQEILRIGVGLVLRHLDDLESQLSGMSIGVDYQDSGRSPINGILKQLKIQDQNVDEGHGTQPFSLADEYRVPVLALTEIVKAWFIDKEKNLRASFNTLPDAVEQSISKKKAFLESQLSRSWFNHVTPQQVARQLNQWGFPPDASALESHFEILRERHFS